MAARFSRNYYLSVSLLSLAFGSIEAAQGLAGALFRGEPHPYRSAFIYSWLPWFPVLFLAPPLVWLAERWPLDRGRWRAMVPRHLAAMVAFIAVHEAAAAAVTAPWIGMSFPLVLIKQITYRSVIDAVLYWGIVGATLAYRTSREAREREQAAVQLEAGLTEARLTALRAQLDPHFLFNTLNAVSALALRGEREGVVRALSTLSDMLRTTLGGAPTQEVPLADELALLERYLEIQRLRFSDRLQIVYDIEPAACDAAVPAMLLQPLVENAVQHGVAARPGAVRIEICAARRGDTLHLEVRDTGPGFFRHAGAEEPAAQIRERIGLGNTRERLAQLYGAAHTFECRDADGAGAIVAVTLPYRAIPSSRPAPAAALAPTA
jgi:two-component system, LytTR family, sensor kinase